MMFSRRLPQTLLRRTHLRAWLHACLLAALLAGLLPPPLVTTLAPTNALTAQAARLLPDPQTAKAAAQPDPILSTGQPSVALQGDIDHQASQAAQVETAFAAQAAAPLAASTLGLGNGVWQDTNANGLQDTGEPGLANLTVGLYDSNGIPVLCVQDQTRYYLDAGGGLTDSQGDLDWSGSSWTFSNAGTTTGGNPANTIYVNGNGSAARSVDLSAFGANPTFTYDYAYTNIAAGYQHIVEYSINNGSTWTTLAFYTSGVTTGWQQASFTLPSLSATARIRIRGLAGTTSNSLRIDNLRIEGGIPTQALSVTDSTGHYSFDDRCVQPSTLYKIGVALAQSPLTGLSLTTANAGSVTSNDPTQDDNDSDASNGTLIGAAAAVITATSLATGVNNGYDFGFAPVGIGDRIWKDANANGLQDSGELGIAGVKIGLYSGGNPVMCPQVGVYDTYADGVNSGVANGSTGSLNWGTTWSFAGSAAPSAVAGNPGGSMYVYGVTTSAAVRAVDLSSFDRNPTLRFDYIRGNGTASFNIQYSSNGGASFTTLDTLTVNNASYQTITYTLPITAANAQIRIQGQTGAGIYGYFDNITIQGRVRSPVTTITDANGFYSFTGADCVQPSTPYELRIDRMQSSLLGLGLTTLHAGNVISDSDVVSRTINNLPYAVITATAPSAGLNTSDDAGFVDLVIGNTIWRDNNSDARQDPNEPGIAGVTVGLYNANGTPVQCVQTQTSYYLDTGGGATDSAGDLNWSNQAWTFTSASITSGGYPGNTIYVYGNGTATRAVDLSVFGAYPTLSYDYAYANMTTGYGHNVEYSADGGTTWTKLATYVSGDNTTYQSASVALPSLSANARIRINGVAGTTNNYLRIDNLRIEGAIAIPAISMTDGDGHYHFNGRCIQPNTTYQLRVDQQQAALHGLYLTASNVGGVTNNDPSNDDTDSDATGTTFSNTPFAVINFTAPAFGVNNSYDFGFVESGIGNYIWKDDNVNGLQDSSEPGISDVVVSLYNSNGASIQCVQTQTGDYLDTGAGATDSAGSFGWAGSAWTFTSASITSGGNPGNTVYVYGNGSATRAVNLSVFGVYPTLSYDYAYLNTTTGYSHVVEYSTDNGTTWTKLATYVAGSGTTYQSASFTLPSLSANARIRIRGLAGTTSNYLRVDNVHIEGGIATPAATMTNSNGRYSFDGACVQPNGAYQVRIDTTQWPLKGLHLTTANAGNVTSNSPISDTTDSDATSTTISNTAYAVIAATMSAAGINYGYDAGFVPVEIGNYVWKDNNANGLQDAGEPGIAGVTVGLYTNAVTPVAVQCVQDETRYYLDTGGSAADNLGSLDWGNQAWNFSNAATTTNGNPGNTIYVYGNGSATHAVNLAVFGANPTLSYDYAYLNTTTGYSHVIEYSTNGGGAWTTLVTYTPSNSTVWRHASFTLPTLSANASIRIRGTAGTTGNYLRIDNLRIEGGINTPATTVTDANGHYSFDGAHCVQPSTPYRLRIDMKQAALRGLSVTTRDAGSDDTIDSDARGITSNSIPYAQINTATAPAAGVNYSNDFGFTPVEIGDLAWQDNNTNGLQDPGEPGIPGVTLHLYDALGSLVQCVQDQTSDYLDQGGGATDSQGALDWSSRSWTFASAGTSTGGNPGNAIYVYGNGSAKRVVDLAPFAGTYPTLSYDYAYLNATGGYYHTIEYSTNNGSTWTMLATYGAGSGATWQQASFILPVSTGTVLLQIRGTAGTTTNRLLIDNLRIEGSVATDATAVTDANGHYRFDGRCVQPSTLASSTDYQVRVDTTQAALTGLHLTTANVNDPISDTIDSDALTSVNDAIVDFSAPLAGVNASYDLGFVPVEIGDKVWKDSNGNGRQDSGEPGIPGVTVSLYDTSGAAMQCTQIGRYDTYRDGFDGGVSNGSNGTLNWATSWVHTNTAVTTNNGNPSGSLRLYSATNYYATRVVNLAVFAGNPALSLDYNFGGYAQSYNILYSSDGGTTFLPLATLSDNNNAYKTITYTLPITVATAQIRIQGVVGNQYSYFDNVIIQGQQRFPVTAVTDANGHYAFTGANCVQPNTSYQVRIDTTQAPLFGLSLTPQNVGGVISNDPIIDSSDSDASGVKLSGIPTAIITATAPAIGANDGYDAGFVPSPIGSLRVNKTMNGGAAPKGWSFTLSSENCLLPPSLTNPMTTTTGTGGAVTFANLLVKDGAGVTCQYQVNEKSQSGWFLNYAASSPVTAIGVTANNTTTVQIVNDTVQTCKVGNGNVGGTVFQDFNMDGKQSSATLEPAFTGSGIVVRAYGKNNQLLAETSLQPDGTYVFKNLANLTTDGVRIEFQNLPSWLEPTAFTAGGTPTGKTSNTLVRFVNAATCAIDLGVNEAVNYCQANPRLATDFYHNGDPMAGGGTAQRSFLVDFPYMASGTDPYRTLGTGVQVGATWGLAYQSSTKTLFASAFQKRFVGFGPLDTGGLYAINVSGTTPVATPFLDLKTLGIDTGIDPHTTLPKDPAYPSTDPNSWDAVGKISMGDMDISADGKTLYIMNLKTRELLALDIASKTVVRRVPVPDPGCLNSRSNPPAAAPDDRRPWAIEVYRDQVYIGVTCSAETSQLSKDLHGYVLKLTAQGFTPFYDFPFSYSRTTDITSGTATWNPWTPKYITPFYPEPVLSDIEFDVDGSLILDIMDRNGHQSGYFNYTPNGAFEPYWTAVQGDLLRVCNVNGVLTFEGKPGCAQTQGTTEYYNDNQAHHEGSKGGSALIPGTGEVAMTFMDPLRIQSGGVRRLRNSDGADVNNYEIYFSGYGIGAGTFGKAGGLGDLEALCDSAPLEIGNRVWNDNNNPNGIQDPGEPGIPGVQVRLYDITGTVIATTTTNVNGEYYFNSKNVPGGLKQNTDYTIRINRTQTPLNGLNPTLLNQVVNNDADPDEHDSDGDPMPYPGYVTTSAHTGGAGQNDYSYDFGFRNTVQIGNRLWIESDSDGDVNTGTVTPVVGQVVTATSSSGKVYTATTDIRGYYTISVPVNNVYTVTTGIPAGTTPSTVITNVATDANAAANDNKNHLRTGTRVTVVTQNNYSIDFGFHAPLVKFGDRVWLESDADGLASTGTLTPIAGMLITATNGTNVYTTLTTAQGYYSFTVPAGTYTVTYGSVPNSYGVVVPSATPGGSSETGNVGVYAETGNPDHSHTNNTTVTLTDGQANWHVDFGFHAPLVKFGDRVWLESDADGLANTGVVTPVVGMVITATNGTNIYTTATNANGYYSFTVLAGTYTVIYGRVPSGYGVVVPSATPGDSSESGNAGVYAETGNPDRSHTNNTTVTLTDGQANWQVDFGFHTPLVQFGDRVWLESDTDGVASTGTLTPIVGMTITATNGAQVYTTTTNAVGYYNFTVLAGTYTVTYGSVPSGYGVVVPSATPGGSSESGNAGVYAEIGNPDRSHTNHTTVTLTDGQANWQVDFGFHAPLVQFGDRVWLESDSDGLASTGTLTPIAGMVITATNGTKVYTTTTNANGYYSFTVLAGTYTVTYGSVPSGYGATVPSATPDGSSETGNAGVYAESGNPDRSHTNNITVTLTDGQANWHVDFAFWRPNPGVAIAKYTNGNRATHANDNDVPQVAPGAVVTWTYVVTNTGDTPLALTAITVTDSAVGKLMVGGNLQALSGAYTGVSYADNSQVLDGVLGVGEHFTLRVTWTAPDLSTKNPTTSTTDEWVNGCDNGSTTVDETRTTYENMATVVIPGHVVTDTSHFCNPTNPGIAIAKYTNGHRATHANDNDVPQVASGAVVSWTYVVTNTGDTPLMLTAITVTDSVVGKLLVAGALQGLSGVYTGVSYVDNGQVLDGVLGVGEHFTLLVKWIAPNLSTKNPTTSTTDEWVKGCDNGSTTVDETRTTYENMATVVIPGHVMTDTSHFCNPTNPGIAIAKYTNGHRATHANDNDVPQVTPGATVTWTYVVTNTGDTPLALTAITVTDSVVGKLIVGGVRQTLSGAYTGVSYTDNSQVLDGVLGVGEHFTLLVKWIAPNLSTKNSTTSTTDEWVKGCDNGSTTIDETRTTYENMATMVIPGHVMTDTSHFCNPTNPGIAIAKYTNGHRATHANDNDVPQVAPGAVVTWTYVVTNTGDTPLALTAITVTDSVVGRLMVGGVLQTLSVPYTGVSYADSQVQNNVLGVGNHFTLRVTWIAPDLRTKDTTTSTTDEWVKGCDNGSTTPDESRTTYENLATVSIPGHVVTDTSHFCNPSLFSLGNLVWYDNNNNGLADKDEIGLADVVVKLYRKGSATPLATTKTDANGKYLFADLSEGAYIVEVIPPTYVNSRGVTKYYVSSSDTGRADANTPDSRDNDDNGLDDLSNPSVIRSAVVTLTAGAEPNNEFDQNQPINGAVDKTLPANSDFYVDFGLYQPGVIRTALWIDLNADGIRQSSEATLANAMVAIFRFYPSGMSRQATTLAPATDIYGQLVPTQTIGSDGYAYFDNLTPGDYVFKVTPPAGYVLTQGGADPDDNNPHDSNGVLVNGVIQSLPLTLLPGTEPTDDGDGADGNQTIGFGFIALTGIGDRVWIDTNGNGLQDAGEEGVSGVTISLYNAQGVLLATVVTDATGQYHFLNLTPGQYYLSFILPPGYAFTSENLGGDGTIDSDVDPRTGRTPLLQVDSGQLNVTLDVGIVKQPTALDEANEPSAGQQIYLPWISR